MRGAAALFFLQSLNLTEHINLIHNKNTGKIPDFSCVNIRKESVMERYNKLANHLRRRCPQLELRVDEPLSRHTSFHIGGPVRLKIGRASCRERVLRLV